MVKIIYKIFLIFCIISCNNLDRDTTVIGHRGAMGHLTENTIPSINKAIELGVDGIEIDVFKCRSGEIVVFHDKKIDRLTNSIGYIEEFTIDSIRKIKVNNNYDIPELKDVLKIIPKNIFLNIELKGDNTAKKVNEILLKFSANNSRNIDNYIVSSFNWKELEVLRSVNNQIKLAVLCDKSINDALNIASKIKAYAINPSHKLLDHKIVKNIQSLGLKVYPYTVNERTTIKKMKKFNVDGIITDFPERIN
tara:strand:- start:1938 stop:2687 length:750 start_codon:yes stop_codon:yes gene_type:complete